jgi:hypothetical protein
MSQQSYPPPGDRQPDGWTLENQPGSPAGLPPASAAPGPYQNPAYPPGGYPAGGYPPQFYVQPRKTNSLALTSFIVSISGVVMCPLVGIVGAILGQKARKQIRETGEDGDGLALAGVIVGWISFGFLMLIIVIYAVIFAGVFATGGFDSSSGY